MDLTFNIIFLPGSVRYLRLAVLSLLKYSGYRYRLVANGLSPEELASLRQFCQASDRLELYVYPSKRVVQHGSLLSWLQCREKGEYFCFMDPDIFASAPFQEELEAHLADCDVFSSCSHLCANPEDRLAGFFGKHVQTPNGLALATTFFCVYRLAPLRRVIAETGVGFEYHFVRRGHFPEHVQGMLMRLGIPEPRDCDTGKLLNVLSHAYHLRFKYHPLSGLTHIGGLTWALDQSRVSSWRYRLRRLLRRPYVLRDEDIETLPERAGGPETRADQRVRRLRRRVALYFALFLQSTVDNTLEPRLALSDKMLAQRIAAVCSVIRELYREHRSLAA